MQIDHLYITYFLNFLFVPPDNFFFLNFVWLTYTVVKMSSTNRTMQVKKVYIWKSVELFSYSTIGITKVSNDVNSILYVLENWL